MQFPLDLIDTMLIAFFGSNSVKDFFFVLNVSLSINQECNGVFVAVVKMKCELVCPRLVVTSLLPPMNEAFPDREHFLSSA